MYKQPDIYDEAQRRVRNKARFYKHLFFFVAFNAFIITTTLFQGGNPLDPMILTLIWGIGLVFHYLKVFGMPGSGVLSKEWEDKEYRREIERLEKRKGLTTPKEEKLELKEMSKNYRDSDLV